MQTFRIVKLTGTGLARVLNGAIGMTFIVDKFTPDQYGTHIAHVRDYRYKNGACDFQIWSLSHNDYELVGQIDGW